MYIRDIEPNSSIGINLLNKANSQELIDRIIEEPLKKPCKDFYRKGIRTVMSSANKNNIVPKGKKPKKKADVAGRDQYFFLDPPTFEDAGVGYAWIMIDFDTLSSENKKIILELEAREDSDGNKVGEEAIWFVHPTTMGNIDYKMKTGRFDYRLLDIPVAEDEKPIERIEPDPQYIQYEDKAIILAYNDRYPVNTVILRRSIDENTTIEEVEEYFCKISELLKNQRTQNIEINNMEYKGK